jgi:hypothetical protein
MESWLHQVRTVLRRSKDSSVGLHADLDVTNADLSGLVVLCENPDDTGHPTFPTDMSVVRQLDSPTLVVVGAWIGTVEGGVDVKYPQKARAAVAPWKACAADSDASVLLTMHTNRNDRRNLRNT